MVRLKVSKRLVLAILTAAATVLIALNKDKAAEGVGFIIDRIQVTQPDTIRIP